MSREETVILMLDTFQKINIMMAEQYGMSRDEIAKNLDQSSPSIQYMLEAVYDALLEKNIIKKD